MKTFDDWFDELCNGNQIWTEQISMHHQPKTFKECARKVYNKYLADEIFPSMQVARGFVGNVVAKVQPDKSYSKDWSTKALEKLEVEKKEAWVPLTGEARQAKLKEWMEAVSKVEMVSAMPKLTAKQIIEQGDWRAVSNIAPRSEVEKHIVVESHIEKVNAARRKMFLSAFPDATEDEIQAYIDKFKTL